MRQTTAVSRKPRDNATRGRALMVALLACVSCFQQADIVIFSMTSEAIRTDFRLTDTQTGLLNGSALALCYAFAAIPLARIADRGHRRTVVVLSLMLWSAFTALTATAAGFASLFAIRLIIGIGESGAAPASFSLIAARYAPEERAGAMSVLQSGRFLGVIIGLWGAGATVAYLGWRHTFLIFGVPGILLALIIWLCVREPGDIVIEKPEPIRNVLAALRSWTIFHLFALLASATMISYGTFIWAPSFYMRSFGMGAREVGFWLGIAIGAGTMAGTLVGGLLTNRLAVRHPNAGLTLAFWSIAACIPANILAFLTTDKATSLVMMLISQTIGGFCVAPVFASLQNLLPARFRATAMALIMVGVVMVSQGLGPVTVGLISDTAKMAAWTDSLRWSLIIMTALGVWPAWHACRVLKLAPAELTQARHQI